MNPVYLEVAQQIINLFGLRNKVGRTYQVLPFKIIPPIQIGQQILDIQNSLHIIPVFLIYRYTRIRILNNTFQYLGIRSLNIQIHHIQTGSHHFLGCFLSETDNTFQHIRFFGYLTFIRQFQCLRQFIHRQVTLLFSFLGHTIDNKSGTDQQVRQRTKNRKQYPNNRSSLTAE